MQAIEPHFCGGDEGMCQNNDDERGIDATLTKNRRSFTRSGFSTSFPGVLFRVAETT